MLPATFAGDDGTLGKGNPYTHNVIKTLAFPGAGKSTLF